MDSEKQYFVELEDRYGAKEVQARVRLGTVNEIRDRGMTVMQSSGGFGMHQMVMRMWVVDFEGILPAQVPGIGQGSRCPACQGRRRVAEPVDCSGHPAEDRRGRNRVRLSQAARRQGEPGGHAAVSRQGEAGNAATRG